MYDVVYIIINIVQCTTNECVNQTQM